MQGIAYTFFCVECEQRLPAAELAYDTDPDVLMGVCVGCDREIQATTDAPDWMRREVA